MIKVENEQAIDLHKFYVGEELKKLEEEILIAKS